MAEPVDLTPENAPDFLEGCIPLHGKVTASRLPGGVSNTVILIEDADQRIILKQSLPRLNVQDEWLAERSRILREWSVMRKLGVVLPTGRLPELLFRDDSNYLYAMRAAPVGFQNWKTQLLAGECNQATAQQVGATLGLMIRETWRNPQFCEEFSECKAFVQLRTDPYYRTIGKRHPQITSAIEEWIAIFSERRDAIVHGDWSPKNLLLTPLGLICIDFECAHFGDPSYDAAFLLNHLILKAFHRNEMAMNYLQLAHTAFTWTSGLVPAEALGEFERSTMRHLAFLLLARIDGKSPVEYLPEEARRSKVRQFAMQQIAVTPETLREMLAKTELAL